MKRTGGIITTTALLAALTACSAQTPETAPTQQPAAEATTATQEPAQEPTKAPTQAPAPEPAQLPTEPTYVRDGIDLAANYPDADTTGFITQYRAITQDTTTPDEGALMGGYELCYDMDIDGVQAVIDEGTAALTPNAPTEEDARNIASLLTYAAAKHICTWNEQHVLETIRAQ